jgi:microcystin-dependent protein
MGQPYLGEIILAGFALTPTGYLPCNGQLVPINQYPALFSLLGTNFGGDGRSNFGLPDLRSRAPIHFGQGPGLTPYNLGDVAGVEMVQLTVSQLALHSHAVNASTQNGDSATPTSDTVWARSKLADRIYRGGQTNAFMNPGAVGTTGGGQAHENRQPYLALNYFIAVQGVFPTRN